MDQRWALDIRLLSTVTRCSRSRDGRVDGEKCSFRKMLCLIICSRLRTAAIRESALPATVRGLEDLD